MDGVLFDTERMSCECCFEAAKQLGLTLAEEAVYGGCGRNEASLRRHIMETEEPWYPNGTFPYEKISGTVYGVVSGESGTGASN